MERLAKPKHFDNSRLQVYAECPKKYFNKYVLGLADPMGLVARFSEHLFHGPITEWYYNGKGWSPSSTDWQERYDRMGLTKAEADVKANAVYSLANAKKLFDYYTTNFADDHDRFTILGIEEYLVDPVLGFGSKPDVRAIDKATGRGYTIELKFSGWDFILEASIMNPQFIGQVNNTGGDACLLTLVQPNGPWTKFHAIRDEIKPTPQDLRSWKQDKIFEMETINRSYATDVWPKNTPHACTNYNGCFFLELCTAGHPEGMLERMPLAGDPLDYLGGGLSRADRPLAEETI